MRLLRMVKALIDRSRRRERAKDAKRTAMQREAVRLHRLMEARVTLLEELVPPARPERGGTQG